MAYTELSIHNDSLRNVAIVTVHTHASGKVASGRVGVRACVICTEAEITNFGIIYYNMYFLQKGDCM